MSDKEIIQKVDTDRIEGEYILKDTDPDRKKIIFSTVIWYDPENGKYYFKSESDMNGNILSGQIVSHKLIQDLLSISKWTLKPYGKLWDDGKRTRSGGVDKKRKKQKKAESKIKHWVKPRLTPAQREEHDKKLATIKREGCCPRCHRRFTPEDESAWNETGNSQYLCKWCNIKCKTHYREEEFSDFTKEDSK